MASVPSSDPYAALASQGIWIFGCDVVRRLLNEIFFVSFSVQQLNEQLVILSEHQDKLLKRNAQTCMLGQALSTVLSNSTGNAPS